MFNFEILREEFKQDKFNPLKAVYINYKMLIKNFILLIPLFILLIVNKFYKFQNILILKVFIYTSVIILLEFIIFKRKKYSMIRLLFFYIILFIYQLIPFQYVFLIFPIMILTRKLKLSETLSLSSNIIIKNIINFFIIIILNTIILTFIIFIILYILSIFMYNFEYNQVDKLREFINSNMAYFEILVNYIIAIQFYVVYKILEYVEIIKKYNLR